MDDFSSARPNTEEGASQGAQSCKTHVSSRFAFRITASWGAQSHKYGRFESFRVSEHRFIGCPIPQCGRFESFCASWGAQSRNLGCANNKYIVCHAMVVCCCVSRGNARNRMHFAPPPQKKLPSGKTHLPLSVQSPALPPRGTPPLQSGGQNQTWPTSGQGGYITPAA